MHVIAASLATDLKLICSTDSVHQLKTYQLLLLLLLLVNRDWLTVLP